MATVTGFGYDIFLLSFGLPYTDKLWAIDFYKNHNNIFGI